MPGIVTISNPQTLVKDTYAPAPKIDLTVRANGEERVMVMDHLAQWNPAGFDAPTTAATLTTLASAGTFEAAKYWGYTYVYVSKNAYPLVENAVTGNGDQSPRSNPAPKVMADSVTNTNTKQLKIPTTERGDISHIWVYRSLFFGSAAEASDFTEAGNVFWIGEVANNPSAATVPFDDNGSIVGLEQAEYDNFPAPQFSLVVYADPFFYGFGNNELKVEVIIDATGLATIANPLVDKWYDGRNGQIIQFDGVTSGGADNHGTYYFKYISPTEAQVYFDIGLTIKSSLPLSGTTYAHIKGPSTVLYRSKPRNPFSWGFTDLIGELQVPQPYQFSVGGGFGTAIAVIPNLNLLKLDTEAPNKCYTLNLKNAGTPNFESSLRSIADTYCVSNHHSQFSATLERGQNVLWAVDTKAFAVIECDGSSQVPISDPVFKLMRTLSKNPDDRKFFHGAYCPRMELNCMFVRTNKYFFNSLNKMIYQHGPTGQWGTMDALDVLCSAQLHDRNTGQMKLLVGTETGFLGEMFAEDKYLNWFEPGIDVNGRQNDGIGRLRVVPDLNVLSVRHPTSDVFTLRWLTTEEVPFKGMIGNWATIILKYIPDSPSIFTPEYRERYFVKITGIANVDEMLTFGVAYQIADDGTLQPTFWQGLTSEPAGYTVQSEFYLGLIEMEVGRSFSVGVPFNFKLVEEFWSTWRLADPSSSQTVGSAFWQTPTIEWFNSYITDRPTARYEKELRQADHSDIDPTKSTADSQYTNWGVQTEIPIDAAKVFGVVLRNRNNGPAQLMNYEFRLTNTDGDNG